MASFTGLSPVQLYSPARQRLNHLPHSGTVHLYSGRSTYIPSVQLYCNGLLYLYCCTHHQDRITYTNTSGRFILVQLYAHAKQYSAPTYTFSRSTYILSVQLYSPFRQRPNQLLDSGRGFYLYTVQPCDTHMSSRG